MEREEGEKEEEESSSMFYSLAESDEDTFPPLSIGSSESIYTWFGQAVFITYSEIG